LLRFGFAIANVDGNAVVSGNTGTQMSLFYNPPDAQFRRVKNRKQTK
jgi:hypothetical protein